MVKRLWVIIIALMSGTALADVVVCKDGRRIRGEVTQKEGMYIITAYGAQLVLPQGEVAEVIEEAPQAPAAPDLHPVSPPKPRSIEASRQLQIIDQRLKRAENALAANDFDNACSDFHDVLHADPKNARASHGLALAYVGLGDPEKALQHIERAMTLTTAGGGVADRALALNFAMIQIANHNAVRAAKFLGEYLTSHPEPLDETAINALAVALDNVDPRARRGNPTYHQLARQYGALNERLEAARPEFRRWGVEWIPVAEYAQHQQKWNAAQARIDEASDAVERAYGAARSAGQELAHLRRQRMVGFASAGQVTAAERRLALAKQQYANAVRAHQMALQKAPRPEFPSAIAMCGLDETVPPENTTFAATEAEFQQMAATGSSTRTAPVPEPVLGTGDEDDMGIEPMPQMGSPTQLVVRRQAEHRPVMRSAAAVPIAPDLLITAASAVRDARSAQIEDLEGNIYEAVVVRQDTAAGLALLRLREARLVPVRLAENLRGGAVQCIGFAPGIFQLRAESIAGAIRTGGGGPSLSLPRAPRRTAAPVVANGSLIGLALVDHGTDLNHIRIVSIEEIRQFCGRDLANEATSFAFAMQVICEVTATSE